MIPQLIIFLSPDGTIHAEEPTTNGARRKLPPFPVEEVPWEWREALLAQARRLALEESARRDKLAAAESARRRSVFFALASDHNLPFAERVMPYIDERTKRAAQKLIHSKPHPISPADPNLIGY